MVTEDIFKDCRTSQMGNSSKIMGQYKQPYNDWVYLFKSENSCQFKSKMAKTKFDTLFRKFYWGTVIGWERQGKARAGFLNQKLWLKWKLNYEALIYLAQKIIDISE